jgi:hypothetical protein
MRMYAPAAIALSLLACSKGEQEPAKHAIDCGVLPPAFYHPDDPAFWRGKGIPIEPTPVNQITLHQNGKVLWNKKEISHHGLVSYLALVSDLQPVPYASFSFEAGASCAQLTKIRDLMLAELRCAENRVCLKGDYEAWRAELSAKL